MRAPPTSRTRTLRAPTRARRATRPPKTTPPTRRRNDAVNALTESHARRVCIHREAALAPKSQCSSRMFRSLNVAATGMAAQETKLDTIANNLANSNTTGYKRQDAEFEDLLYQNVRAAGPTEAGGMAPTGTQIGSGVRVVATSRAFSQGSIQQTGNPLDVAIEGSGFLAVSRSNGEIGYTRAGSLKLDAQGKLVTSDGLPIEPPITVPPDATSVTIGADGTVSATQPGQHAPNTLGQLQIVTFANPN